MSDSNLKLSESQHYYARAAAIPSRSLTRSKAPGVLFDIGTGPLYAVRGDGCILTDVDNNDYIDMVCALGAVGKARGLDMSKLAPEDIESVAAFFEIPRALAAEVVYMNDEGLFFRMDADLRYRKMREWIEKLISGGKP